MDAVHVGDELLETVVELLRHGSLLPEVINLADHRDEIFAWPSDEMAALNARVAESDFAVFASRTYMTGCRGLLLKHSSTRTRRKLPAREPCPCQQLQRRDQ